jgi:hypothetical protein
MTIEITPIEELGQDLARDTARTAASRLGTTERRALPGELCTCGRPAVTVFETVQHGDVGYCGIPDGGATR